MINSSPEVQTGSQADVRTEPQTRTRAEAEAEAEIQAGERFAFGDNWRAFIELIDEARIDTATRSLTGPLGETGLAGRTFLDAGCGSGLFSLAAHRLGARVTSFDFDPQSVGSTMELRRRFGRDAPGWSVAVGSVLDEEYVAGLGEFDVVYSWGVLHHTGDMWCALDLISSRVAPRGLLYISIYNDQGAESRIWRRVKRLYNRSGRLTRHALVALSACYLWRRRLLVRMSRIVRPGAAAAARPPRARGMSVKHDLYDWVGGYPFEVAKPEEVLSFLRERGFGLRFLKTCGGGIGCNEYVFERTTTRPVDGAMEPAEEAAGEADGEDAVGEVLGEEDALPRPRRIGAEARA